MRTNLVKLATTGAVAALMIVPSLSFADGRRDRQNRDQWNNIAIGSAALGVIGLLGHNDTLAAAGLVGAGYSVYRANTVDGDCDRWDRWDRSDRWDRHDFRYDRDRNDHRRDNWNRDDRGSWRHSER